MTKKFIIKILDYILNIVNSVTSNLNKIRNYINSNEKLKILAKIYHPNYRYILYTLHNINNLENKEAFKALYNTLINDEEFLKFGYKKIIFVTGETSDEYEISCHHNVYIDNNTSFNEYWDLIKDKVSNLYTESRNYSGYYGNNTNILYFNVKVWNIDLISNNKIKIKNLSSKTPHKNFNLRSFHTSALNKKDLLPLKNCIIKTPELISTLDIETIDYLNEQIPIAISIAWINNEEIQSKLFLIDPNLLYKDYNKAIANLFSKLYLFINENSLVFKNIFCHNLGNFDGFFIYKYLLKIIDNEKISALIDHNNKFVTIKINKKIKIKDSYRIFPVSLEQICNIFSVEGKFLEYNIENNNINLFKDKNLLEEFKKYSLQDSICLLNALIKAQKYYINKYNIDITSIFSTSTLSLKIFRQNFMKHNIPVLKHTQDNFIRKSYFGGATDYYKAYGENLYYYDVNSLYPWAMKQPIPYKLIRYYKDLSNYNLNQFFGFLEVEVETPKNILKPLLPYRYEGETIFPIGNWKGIYFSEELKALIKYGYKFKLIRGYEFSKIDLFSDYVDHFYNLKKTSEGPLKFIAKMQLNQLYGIFGRKLELIETININNKDLIYYVTTRTIKSIIEINEEKSVLLLKNNIDKNIINKINVDLNINKKSLEYNINSNVSIASAITAYARIFMMPYKINYDCYYSDTDSIFISEPLPNELVGVELGQFKNELSKKSINNKIQEAYFLGIKQYGYWFYDNSKNKIEKSVIAGIKRDTIYFETIKDIFNHKIIEVKIENRFFKSLKNLKITIKKDIITKIFFNPKKKLINNQYKPILINNSSNKIIINNYFIWLIFLLPLIIIFFYNILFR